MGCKGGAECTFGVGIGRTHIQCVFALGGVGVDVKGRGQPPARALPEKAVVLHPQADAQTVLDATLSAALPADVPEAERQALRALILDELRRLHEGVLARYGLRPSQLKAWKDAQGL